MEKKKKVLLWYSWLKIYIYKNWNLKNVKNNKKLGEEKNLKIKKTQAVAIGKCKFGIQVLLAEVHWLCMETVKMPEPLHWLD